MSPFALLVFAGLGAPQHPPRVQEFAVELIDMPRIDTRAPIRRMGFWLRFRNKTEEPYIVDCIHVTADIHGITGNEQNNELVNQCEPRYRSPYLNGHLVLPGEAYFQFVEVYQGPEELRGFDMHVGYDVRSSNDPWDRQPLSRALATFKRTINEDSTSPPTPKR